MKDRHRHHPRRRPAWGKIIAALVVVAALAAAWRWTPLSEYVTAERMAGWARAMRGWTWAPLVVVLSYTPAAFVMFPRPLLTLLTVIAFGPWWGFTYSMVGIMLSAVATYYAGRFMSQETVKRIAGDNVDQIKKPLRKHGFLAVLAIRLMPAAPFVVEGIIAGALRIKLWDYNLGTFLGMVPGVLATSVFGHQLSAALEDPSKINWWIVAAVIVAMVLFSWYVRRWFARQNAEPEAKSGSEPDPEIGVRARTPVP